VSDLDGFAGEVIRPGDPAYDGARVVWNALADRRPALVVRPTGAADVITAVRYARENDLLIAVRSGGHSTPGLSTCDDGIVIDLSRMRGVRVDPDSRLARVNGGALLRELDHEAQAFGLACPVGVVSHTGVAGLTLGGGIGRLQRRFGLTIDSLASVDLVTADGRLVRASEAEHPDLFWGLRGAGPNFGIVTSFEFRLHPLSRVITHGVVIHPVERAVEVAGLVRELAADAPRNLWLSFGVGLALPAESFPPGIGGGPIARVAVHHCGTPEEAARDLAELRAFGQPISDSIAEKPYLQAQTMNDEATAWGHRFYMTSAFLSGLPDEAAARMVDVVSRVPSGSDGGFSNWVWGGAIADVPEDATAFSGRNAAFWMGAEIEWDDPDLDDACRAWAREARDALAPFALEGRYANDVADPEEPARAIYGDAKLERLVALKRTWDPDNTFRLNQNVRP
jgi:FAD/FMN-containing dehydrogenase